VYSPVFVRTHVEATWAGWEMLVQRRENNDARNALRLKAKMKEVQIIAMDIGTIKLIILHCRDWLMFHLHM
jgi:hypothetical protein